MVTKIIETVRHIIECRKNLQSKFLSDRQRTQWEREVEALEKRIDNAVFKLYDVDGLPE